MNLQPVPDCQQFSFSLATTTKAKQNLHINISTQSLDTGFHSIENMFSGKSDSVHQVSIIVHHLRDLGLVDGVIVVGNAKVAFRQ